MREADIRPDELKKNQSKVIAADIRWLLSRRESFVRVDCPACGSAGYTGTFEKNGFEYSACGDCGTLFMNPRPSREVLDEFYRTSENYKYWKEHIFPASEHARREKIFRPRAARVASLCAGYGIRDAVLMEVGAGFGTFCEEAGRYEVFKRITAVEPTPDLAEACRKRGLEVIEKPIEEVVCDAPVDVIVAFEVIEHLFSPGKFIGKCASVLSPGGIMVVTCPNAHGFDIDTLGKLSDSIDHEHLNYFNPESLASLIAGNGFEVLEVSTPGELDAELVRKKVLAGEFDVSGQPFLKRVLIDEWERLGDAFQRFLAENRLSSHMWVVARKA